MFLLGAILTQIKDGISYCSDQNKRSKNTMPLTDTQVFIALAVALFPGIMALRLSTELYK
jgi:photosystem I subunit XII